MKDDLVGGAMKVHSRLERLLDFMYDTEHYSLDGCVREVAIEVRNLALVVKKICEKDEC